MKSFLSFLFLLILIIGCKPNENLTPNGKTCLVSYLKVNEKNGFRLFIPGLDTVYKERPLIDSNEYLYEFTNDNKISKITLNLRSGIDETDSLQKPLFLKFIYEFTYDNKGFLTKTDVSWDNFSYSGETKGYILEYSYENNRLTTFKKIHKSMAPLFEMRKFTYDTENNLSSIQYTHYYNGSYTSYFEKGNSKFSDYTYDNNGQLIKLSYWVGSDMTYSFEFDNNKNMTYMEAKLSGKFYYSFENKYDDKKQMVFFDPNSFYRTKSGNDSFPYYTDNNVETPVYIFGQKTTVIGRANFLEGKNNQIYSKFTIDHNQNGKPEVIEIRNDYMYDSEGNPISYKRYFNNVFSGNEMSAQYICK